MATTESVPFVVHRDRDRQDARRSVGIGDLFYKVTAADSDGALFVAEIVHREHGGPPRHLHRDQDEWFLVTEGRYIVEIGDQRHELGPGDSAYGPRGIPHCWTNISDGQGRLTFVFTPAGRAEAFFDAITSGNAMAPTDPAFWEPFDMALVGPPLAGE